MMPSASKRFGFLIESKIMGCLMKFSIVFLWLLIAAFFTSAVFAADYPPNIDYGDRGDFLAKRATENGRAAVIMPIGPVVVNQPERPGSSSTGIEGGRDLKNSYWDLSDLTNPTLIEPIWCSQNPDVDCFHSMPIGAHGTIIRIDDANDEAYLYEPAHFSGRWTTFDPDGATSELQMGKLNLDKETHGTIGAYEALTTPWIMQLHWTYGEPPITTYADGSTTGNYQIRDPRFFDDLLNPVSISRGPLFVEWDHLGDTGVTGFPIWLGQHLVYASDQAQTGLAIYDMRGYKDGVEPTLLSLFNQELNKPTPNNGITERIGGYWMETYGTDKIIFAARRISAPVEREFASMYIVDISDKRNPVLSCEIYFDQDAVDFNDGDASSDPMYVHFQDGYAFVDHFRVDIQGCEDAYAGDGVVDSAEFAAIAHRYNDLDHSCDASQYFRPLGQVAILGGYDFFQTDYVIEYTGEQLPRAPTGFVSNTGNGSGSKSGNDVFANYGINENGNHESSWRSADIAAGDVLTHGGVSRTVVSVRQNIDMNEQGLCFIVAHDEPDTTAPFVSGHAPLANETNVPVDTFVHIHIPETLRSETLIDAIYLRNTATGIEVPSRKQLNHTGLISIWPDNDLDVDVNYTVSLSGIEDFMGNAMADYSFSFTTGDDPIAPVDPIDPPDEEPTATPSYAGVPYYPNHSSEMSCSPESELNNIAVVNPDNHSFSIIDTALADETFEFSIASQNEIVYRDAGIPNSNYLEPSSVTRANEFYVVTYRDSDNIVFYNTDGTIDHEYSAPYGSQPISSVSDGAHLYVALFNSGDILKINIDTKSTQSLSLVNLDERVSPLRLRPTPRGMALQNGRLLVTRYISDAEYGEVYDIDTSDLTLSRVITVNKVIVPDDLDHGTGIPNFLKQIVFSEDGTRAYIPAIKQNIESAAIDDDNTVRPMLVTLDLVNNVDLYTGTTDKFGTHDYDNKADPTGITYLVDGETQVVTFRGNEQILLRNLSQNTASQYSVEFAGTGAAPIAACSTLRHLYVKSFTDRSVTVFDVSDYLDSGDIAIDSISFSTVENELLGANELDGLQWFYTAKVPEMGPEGYMSCASCHAEGSADWQNWDLSGMGEGMRNTLSLNGTGGTRFGNLHWSQNFDEVQDFLKQVEILNGGVCLGSDELINSENSCDTPRIFPNNENPLNVVTTGRSTKIDNINAYIASLDKDSLRESSNKRGDGSLRLVTSEGKRVFTEQGCASCHSGDAYRDGLAHNTGMTSAGVATQTRTPTLIGLFESAPYLHDGRAETLADVFTEGVPSHNLSGTTVFERSALFEFLNQLGRDEFIDDDAEFAGGVQ